MNKFVFLLLVFITAVSRTYAQEDAEGSKDPPLFTRMPGYHIYRYDDLQFDKYEFKVSDSKSQVVEGHHLLIYYDLNNNVTPPSPLQVGRNYINAIKKIGGQLVYEYDDAGENVVLKIAKNGIETWAYIYASGNGSYTIHLIEKESMKQDVVADANSLMSSIKETGKVAVYGIYFDSGKSVLKPESDPTLQEISKLLKNNPDLKLYVVGHTDNTGIYESNIKLSMDRASAVINALVTKYSVTNTRLTACGDGPTAPVATNDTEEGKALNRRVELVKK
jgi:OmpA-OmpF porin, OOP family